jgi:hypothetical protein
MPEHVPGPFYFEGAGQCGLFAVHFSVADEPSGWNRPPGN